MAGDNVPLLSEETESCGAKHALLAGAAGSSATTEGYELTSTLAGNPAIVGQATPAWAASWTGYDPSGSAGTAPPAAGTATSNPFSF